MTAGPPPGSCVEVEGDLPRVRPRLNVGQLLALQLDPPLDQILIEDAPLQQEGVVLLERVERSPEGEREGLQLLPRWDSGISASFWS